MSNQSRCRSCGASILWVISPNGKKMPLDLRAPCYVADDLEEDGDIQAERAKDTFVSHFATCPDASKHSKSGTQKSLL